MKIEQPNYYAIIPASVRYCKSLSANAKLLYGEITALASTDRGCFARNSYFANLFDVDCRTIARWINQLEELGFIERDTSTDGDSGRVLRLRKHCVPQKTKHERDSYQEIFDNFCVSASLQSVLWEFIKHCQLNGRILTNDKLMNILVRLDMNYRFDENSKVASIQKAIQKGYFDISEI